MSAVPKPRQGLKAQGQRTWTDAQRADQARKLRTSQIWLKSTGPRTEEGKATSSRNARSPHYEETRELKAMCRYLRVQKSYTDLLKFYRKQEDSLSPDDQNQIETYLDIFENELIDLERQICGGLRFYDVIGLENRQNRGNVLPFCRP